MLYSRPSDQRTNCRRVADRLVSPQNLYRTESSNLASRACWAIARDWTDYSWRGGDRRPYPLALPPKRARLCSSSGTQENLSFQTLLVAPRGCRAAPPGPVDTPTASSSPP